MQRIAGSMTQTLHEAIHGAIRATLETSMSSLRPKTFSRMRSTACAHAAVDAVIPYVEMIVGLRRSE